MVQSSFYCLKFISIALLILAIRILWLYSNLLPLYPDEAQYWYWSNNLDFGYYSKPPIVAWAIWLGKNIFGESEFGIRIVSPITHFITSIVIFLIGTNLRPKTQLGFYSGILYLSLPAVTISSGIISTDPFLLLFWSLTLLFFIRATGTNDFKYWIFAGIFFGMGMLSKYSMGMFLVSAFAYLCWRNRSLKFLMNYRLWIAMIIGGLVFLPNVLWNLQYGMVSFQHTGDLVSSANEFNLKPHNFLIFLIAQLGIFGIFLFPLLGYIAYKWRLWDMRPEYQMLASFTYIFLVIITLIATVAKAHVNWAAPTYIAGVILVSLFCLEHRKERWLRYSLIFNVIILIFITIHQPLMNHLGIKLNRKNDIFYRMRGGDLLGEQVKAIHANYPQNIIAVDTRKEISLLNYYARGEGIKFVKWNPSRKITDHFALTTNLENYIGSDVLLITFNHNFINEVNKDYFGDDLKVLGKIRRGVNDEMLYVYLIKRFKGYG